MKLRSTLLAATVLATPLAARAQWATQTPLGLPVTGLYIGAGAGVNWLTNQDITSSRVTPSGVSLDTNLTSRIGPVVLGSVGWGFGNGLRVEVEGDYRNNALQKITGARVGVTASGNIQQYGPMVNAFYDFVGYIPYVVPYIGAGVGYQWAYLQHFGAFGTFPAADGFPGGSFQTRNGRGSSEGSFAYQAIVGLGVPIPAIPGLQLTAEYRFMGLAGSRDYDEQTSITTSTGTTLFGHGGTLKLSSAFNNAVLVGFRYNFGVAPPPPPPAPVVAPAPAPARSYLVFFDWDRATLTDRAREIIREAAIASTHVQYTQILVNGYTDTSGTFRYNMGLSIRRANAVAAELVRNGVPRNVISIHGYGETHLLVPTGPGVREPQNRRVEIIIQ
jgi:OmpA-OmpF porin, OOP family